MRCYHCGGRLSEKDFCTNCGADVYQYKKIIYASNRLYNEGLEKARVRDLSGAVISLRQSLKFNKNHIDARNLLGLVYFEMGEVVAALSEWVISKNQKASKNIADDYINMIQANPTRVEILNQTIKKYNLALQYCYQDGIDLAIIQLKKVLSLNPKFIRAHLLLALIYIRLEDWEKAKRELDKCIKIDKNNTQSLLYLKEIESVLELTEESKKEGKRKKSDEVITYQNGMDTIIQPLNPREPVGFPTVLMILIGIAIGVSAAVFLILPARIQSAKAEMREELIQIGEESDAKSVTINDLTQEVESLTSENEELKSELEEYTGTDGVISANEILISAVYQYLQDSENLIPVSEILETIDTNVVEESGSDTFKLLYNYMTELLGPQVSDEYYAEAYTAYNNGEYEEAITLFTKALYYDPTDVEALYNLGNAYRKNGDDDEAIAAYQQLIDDFPDSSRVSKAKNYITSLQ